MLKRGSTKKSQEPKGDEAMIYLIRRGRLSVARATRMLEKAGHDDAAVRAFVDRNFPTYVPPK